MIRNFYSYALVFILTLPVLAGDGEETRLEKADQLFSKRDQGIKHIEAAKKLYKKIVEDKKESLKIRKEALDKYSRLAVFEGEVSREIFQTKDVAGIFEECLEVTEELSPKNIDGEEIAEYVYWRSMCLGLWGANVSKARLLFKMGRVKEMRNLIAIGQEKFKNFDNYGFNRIEAGMYCRSEYLAVLDLYHPDWSVDYIDEALAGGTDNYMSYVLKAEALVSLKRVVEAREHLSFGINELRQRLQENDIPEIVRAENVIFLEKMIKALKALE